MSCNSAHASSARGFCPHKGVQAHELWPLVCRARSVMTLAMKPRADVQPVLVIEPD